MASQAPRFKEDQVLVICPGSQTTMARLGIADLPTPQIRIPTRMFQDPETLEWRPYHTYKRKKSPVLNERAHLLGDNVPDYEDEYEWVEDKDSDEGAIYPLEAGEIKILSCFVAFLDFVHSMLATTYHNTPIVLMTSPQWKKQDCEAITHYIFEKTKTPALLMIHSGLASNYGLKWPNMTVIDIGFEKVDVTCIYEGAVVKNGSLGVKANHRKKGKSGKKLAGGDTFTQKLLTMLQPKGWNYQMCEQLKKSPICEVLPYNPDHPLKMDLPQESGSRANYATGGASEAPKIVEPGRPAFGADNDDAMEVEDKAVDNDGVLDVASIVTSGQTKEFLAKKEKEKSDRAKKKGKDKDDVANAKPVRLPNAKRLRNVFHFEDIVEEEVPVEENGVNQTDTATANGEVNGGTDKPGAPPAPRREKRVKKVRRDLEVGLERFTFADREQIDRIVHIIYTTIQGIKEPHMRPACWDHLAFVGGGSRLKGLKENIMQTLTSRHLISPSTATMFTSELPSNIATPSGTGAQTPTGSFTGAPHQLPTNAGSSGVNPLLQAATTASLGVPSAMNATSAAGSAAGDATASSRHYQQTPTSIKLSPPLTYLSEWTKHGFEDAMFLGSMIAARMAFCLHNSDPSNTDALRTMSLSRVDYNEYGPTAIQTHSMLH